MYARGGWRALGVGERSSSEERKETNVVEATTDQKSCINEETKVEFDKPEFLPHKAGKEWAASAPHLGFRGAAIMKLRFPSPPRATINGMVNTEAHAGPGMQQDARPASTLPSRERVPPLALRKDHSPTLRGRDVTPCLGPGQFAYCNHWPK